MSEHYNSDDDDDERRYSSSDEDGYYCYYCEADLSFENDVFEDNKPCKTRYYCSSCKLHIHTSDIESESSEDDGDERD